MTAAELRIRTLALQAAGQLPVFHRRRKKSAPVPKVPPAPCVHRGAGLTGAERAARNLDHRRRWLYCLSPEQPLGAVVCGCKGCGAKCPGYEVKRNTTP